MNNCTESTLGEIMSKKGEAIKDKLLAYLIAHPNSPVSKKDLLIMFAEINKQSIISAIASLVTSGKIYKVPVNNGMGVGYQLPTEDKEKFFINPAWAPDLKKLDAMVKASRVHKAIF